VHRLILIIIFLLCFNSPQSQRPIICYVCRQPGHLASKCPSGTSSKFRSNEEKNY
jgi:hypothetical protein